MNHRAFRDEKQYFARMNERVLLIDHDDSFTYNLRDWLRPAFAEVSVAHHSDEKILDKTCDLIVLSPGPLSPKSYPHVLQQIKKLNPAQPVLGVCLGLQSLVEASGGTVSAYTPPLHGKTSALRMTKPSVFENLLVARYHSLACQGFESEFDVCAVSADDRRPMWLEHKEKKWIGFQFHPESFLTEKSFLYR
ncbi:MAG: gamma-glutamyl-gamma-aminobutyrate hydrolase family protein, partial [Bdellovibrionaceae bacterium]|nr:gamma-glutamyl-gamma-aminobutyrate hydrolase family protein [Pseudobdellovibrionaceae bacterium]